MGRPRGRPRKVQEIPTPNNSRLRVSPYPEYVTPLRTEGNILVLPDLEMPFHDAVFVNRVLDLAQAWEINQLILAGDMLHFNSLTNWEANWQEPNGHGGLDEKQEEMFIEFAKGLPSSQQARAFQLLQEIGPKQEDGDPNVSEEMRVARKVVRALSDCFRHVYIICGNHEGRLLRAMQSPLFPTEITRLIDAQSWQIKPYYYSVHVSNGQKYRIEHPRSAAKSAAVTLASKYQCHILMAHSHYLSFNWDLSGSFYAIQMGHACDENRMPYASQRSSVAAAHLHGAVIVRDGYPWLLHDNLDWQRMAKL